MAMEFPGWGFPARESLDDDHIILLVLFIFAIVCLSHFIPISFLPIILLSGLSYLSLARTRLSVMTYAEERAQCFSACGLRTVAEPNLRFPCSVKVAEDVRVCD
jgi:hypothetical protein